MGEVGHNINENSIENIQSHTESSEQGLEDSYLQALEELQNILPELINARREISNSGENIPSELFVNSALEELEISNKLTDESKDRLRETLLHRLEIMDQTDEILAKESPTLQELQQVRYLDASNSAIWAEKIRESTNNIGELWLRLETLNVDVARDIVNLAPPLIRFYDLSADQIDSETLNVLSRAEKHDKTYIYLRSDSSPEAVFKRAKNIMRS